MTARIIELASGQGGHVTRAQLGELGLSRGAIYRRQVQGLLHPVVLDTFRVIDPGEPLDLVRGAALTLPRAVVSHHTAAHLHALARVGPDPLTVMVHTRTTHGFPGVTVRRCHDLLDHHITELEGLRVTTPARTIVDLAGVVSKRRIESIVDVACSTGLLHPDEIDECLEQVARRGKPGVAKLRQVLGDRGVGALASASRLERRGLELILDAGLGPPFVEHPIPWSPERRFDLAFVDEQVAIEWDSLAWHTAPDRFDGDRRRDREALINGWMVLRFTWRDVNDRPAMVIRHIKAVLGRRCGMDQPIGSS